MTKTSHFRAGLFATVLLFSTALSVPGFAEEAQLLPDLSSEDIARDVKREYNKRTGVAEYVAPTFDPFEQDATMAGSVNLRSINGSAISIDGESLANGAILDVAFYYSSANDDPYDRRGFDDIAFLSGSFAPAIRRDNRILECSRDVQDIVYNDRFYYAPFLSVGLYRPYRHYGGYRRYGRFDRPYWRNRGYGRHTRGYNRGYRDGWRRGGYDRYDNDRRNGVDNRGRRRGDGSRNRDRNRNDRVRNRDRNRDRNGTVDNRRENRRAAPYVRSDRRGNMRGSVDTQTPRATNIERNRDRSNTRRSATRNNEARRAERRANRNARRAEGQTRRNDRIRTNTRVRTNDRVRDNTQRRNERRALNRERNRDTVRSTPRPQRELRRENRARPEARPIPRREARPTPTPRANPPKRVKNRRTLETIKTSRNPNAIKGQLQFFPKRTNYGRNVVRTVNVDCAREETLSVFIPQGRLDAARYDGLTVLALDSRGEEYPIFIPPNYIEGFQSAVSGSYNIPTGQVIPAPRLLYGGTNGHHSTTQIEAQCPSGTYKQPDGTCMIASGGYP